MGGHRQVVLTFGVCVAIAAAALADTSFDSAGVPIRYVDAGDGPPIVLIHGYTGNLERHWMNNGVFDDLRKDHRVIAIDCRGHGKSGKPTEPDAYGAEMGWDVVRLLDHLKIRRAHVVGYSMGAMIVGWLVATHPKRLLSATFVAHPAVYRWTDADERDAELWARDLESDTPFRALIVAASPAGSAPAEEQIRELSKRMAAANDTKALAAYHRGRHTLAVGPLSLQRAHVPMLAVVGSEDPSVDAMHDFQRAIPELQLVVVDGATHGGDKGILRRAEFLQSLRGFLRE